MSLRSQALRMNLIWLRSRWIRSPNVLWELPAEVRRVSRERKSLIGRMKGVPVRPAGDRGNESLPRRKSGAGSGLHLGDSSCAFPGGFEPTRRHPAIAAHNWGIHPLRPGVWR